MKIKFDSSLAYQHDAIAAVVQTFAGQPLADSHFSVTLASTDIVGTQQSELGIGNQLVLDDGRLLANVRQVQETNQLPRSETLLGRHFSIEMETGTGKTTQMRALIAQMRMRRDRAVVFDLTVAV